MRAHSHLTELLCHTSNTSLSWWLVASLRSVILLGLTIWLLCGWLCGLGLSITWSLVAGRLLESLLCGLLSRKSVCGCCSAICWSSGCDCCGSTSVRSSAVIECLSSVGSLLLRGSRSWCSCLCTIKLLSFSLRILRLILITLRRVALGIGHGAVG